MIPGRPAEKPLLLSQVEAMGAVLEPLGRNDLMIFQLPDSFRFGEEQVCLAHWAAEQITPRNRLLSARGEKPLRIVDPGSGSGILTLLLSALLPGSEGLAVELMDRPYRLLEANLLVNGLGRRFRAEQRDLRDGVTPELLPGSFDLVVANPPYFLPGTGPTRDESTEGAREIAAAREEKYISLTEYLRSAADWLCPGGTLALLHRPLRLLDVLAELRTHGLSPTGLRAITPRAGQAPSAFMIAAKKQPTAGFRWQRDLILRNTDGSYTDEVNAYYWEADHGQESHQ